MFGVYDFPWGSAVKNEDTDVWTNVLISPDGDNILIEGLPVEVTKEGVIFKE